MKIEEFYPNEEDNQRILRRLERLKARTGLTDTDLDALVANLQTPHEDQTTPAQD